MAQTFEPSLEASRDNAGCLTKLSLPADFHVLPLSLETSTPPVVAANQELLLKTMSLTWKATSVGAFVAGRFAATAAPFLPLAAEDAAAGESETNKPALTHLLLASSYFIQPPLFNEAHQPVGAA